MKDNRMSSQQAKRHAEKGNVLFIVLLAIALIGALTVAIQSGNNSETSNIDDETLAIRVSEVQRYASELERAVIFVTRNGISESDIRFAHPKANSDYGDLPADTTPENQVFHAEGGGAEFRSPPNGINNGSPWEFYGTTALPNVGSSAADLIAVLPNVTQSFCERVNAVNNQDSDQPEDTGNTATSTSNAGACLYGGTHGRFDNAVQFYSSPNTTDSSTFTKLPAKQACVQCVGMSGAPYHFYHVILSR